MRLFSVIFLSLLLSACALQFKKPSTRTAGGGYYQDDGPLATNKNLDAIPDATPKIEPLHKGTMKPYTVLGKHYVPNTNLKAYKERGIASWYGKKFHGKKTSIGEPYDMFAMTAAHKTLALPSYARVTRVATGKSVIVRLTDRGPFHEGRIIDLSYAAAYKLGILGKGSDTVIVEAIIPSSSGFYATTSTNPISRKETIKNALRSNISTAQILSIRRGAAASDIAPIQTAFNTAKNVAKLAQSEDPLADFIKDNMSENVANAAANIANATVSAAVSNIAVNKDFDALEAIAIAANAIHVDAPAASNVNAAPTISNIDAPLQKTSVSTLSYFVQLGSFSSAENAQAARAKMAAQLPWLTNLPVVFQSGNVHRVQIGPFANKDDAQELIERIQQSSNLQPALATQ